MQNDSVIVFALVGKYGGCEWMHAFGDLLVVVSAVSTDLGSNVSLLVLRAFFFIGRSGQGTHCLFSLQTRVQVVFGRRN